MEHLVKRFFGGASLTALLLSSTAIPSFAQVSDNGSFAIEEIVVTARRRAENLQDVPVSVTAFSGEALIENGAQDLGDLESYVPNLTLHVGDANNAVVYIRGIGQVDSLAFADPGVGIYLDDVYLGRAQGSFLDVFDVERVEVLRGPQGTLYGRNTIGGAVKFVSKRPSDEAEGHVSAGAGDYGRVDLKASMMGPIAPGKLYVKGAVAYMKRDGYATNDVDGADDYDKDTMAYRLGLVYEPSSDVSFELSVDGSRSRPETSRTPVRATPVFGFIPASEDPFVVSADFNDLSEMDVFGVSGVLNWALSDAVSFKSITSHREMQYKTHLDLDATSFAFFGVFVDQDQDQFSQEFQLSYGNDRLEMVSGLYYFQEHDMTESGLFGPDLPLVTNSMNDQENKSYAIYAHGSYDLSEQLRLSAGLRYTKEEKEFDRVQEMFFTATSLPVPLGTGFVITEVDVEDDWESFSPKIGLDYRVNDDVMLYLSASRGFKSGGFDGRSNVPGDAKPFDPETMWSYEAGMKSTWHDGRLVLNGAVFYNDYTDLQLSSFVADGGGGFAALFTNAGKARIVGAELEATAHVSENFRIHANVGFMDAEYEEFIGSGGVDVSDEKEMVNTPEWTARVSPEYVFDLDSQAQVRLFADVAYRSKVYPTVSSSEELAQDAYTLVDLGVSWTSPDQSWDLSFVAKNVTDEEYIEHGFDLSDSLGYQLAYYGAPSNWFINLTRSF